MMQLIRKVFVFGVFGRDPHKRFLGESVFRYSSLIFSLIVVFVLAGIIISIFIESLPAFSKFGFGFIVSTDWSDSTGEFGALNAIYGSIVGSLIAMLISVPIAIGVSVYLTQIVGSRAGTIIGIGIELLAAIPSIVYGMVGLIFLVPFLAGLSDSYGMGVLTSAIVLSVMALPSMSALMRDSIDTTPTILKESAYALGTTKFEVVRDVIFPYAKVGIIGSIILALSRVLGETMAVSFLIGGTQKIPSSLLELYMTS